MTLLEILMLMVVITNSLTLLFLVFLVTAVRFIGAHIIKFLQDAGNKLKAFGGSGGGSSSGGLLGGIGDIIGLISGLGGGGEAK